MAVRKRDAETRFGPDSGDKGETRARARARARSERGQRQRSGFSTLQSKFNSSLSDQSNSRVVPLRTIRANAAAERIAAKQQSAGDLPLSALIFTDADWTKLASALRLHSVKQQQQLSQSREAVQTLKTN